tara:strand:+ start:380 stop:535 length:156 start_codon:yes stop_codon:yes gene_type:complete
MSSGYLYQLIVDLGVGIEDLRVIISMIVLCDDIAIIEYNKEGQVFLVHHLI